MRLLWLAGVASLLLLCCTALPQHKHKSPLKHRSALPASARRALKQQREVQPEQANAVEEEPSPLVEQNNHQSQQQLQRQLMLQLAAPIFVPIVMRRLTSSWDFNSPSVLRFTRLVYTSFIVAVQLLLAYMRYKIDVVDDQSLVDLPSGQQSGGQQQTVRDYDMEQLRRLQWETVSNMLVGSFLHFVKKWHQAALIQVPFRVISFWNHPLVQIHLRGASAAGMLQRPFHRGPAALFQRFAEQARGQDAVETEPAEEAAEANGPEDVEGIEKPASQGSSSNSDEQQPQERDLDQKRKPTERRPPTSAGEKKVSKGAATPRKTETTAATLKPRTAKSVQAEQ